MANPLKAGIPSFLYRGDGDQFNTRDLKATLHFQQLQTNLLRGGDGQMVFTSPLIKLVANHVDPGWSKTHFLSFSADKKTALRFGLNCQYDEVDDLFQNYHEYDAFGASWDFALIEFSSAGASWEQLSPGVYKGTYEPSLKMYEVFPGYFSVILIDVLVASSANPHISNLADVQANATRDSEWLVLPATPMVMNTGQVEYSGIIDGACIPAITRYRLISH